MRSLGPARYIYDLDDCSVVAGRAHSREGAALLPRTLKSIRRWIISIAVDLAELRDYDGAGHLGMKARRASGASTGSAFAAFMLAVIGAMSLSACNLFDETPTYRYRMTVEVDTPEGLKTGSSVIEVDTRMETNPESPASQRINWRARGEAAVVDLGRRGVMFALLRSDDDVDFASRIMFLLAPKGRDKNGDAFLGRFANMLEMTEPVELPATQAKINPPLAQMKGRPMLVTFADLDDPTSVERVDPDDLAATFGEGVSLKRITVQITDDPVTRGIEKRLGWLGKIAASGGGLVPMIKNGRGRYEVAPGYDNSLADLGLSSFSTEAYK